MAEGGGIFYDGTTARRHIVSVIADEHGLIIVEDAVERTRWPYEALTRQDGAGDLLRVAAATGPELARLEIAEPDLIAAIIARCPQFAQAARAQQGTVVKVVAWSLAAAVSLVLSAIFLVPLVADRLTPLVPHTAERWLGDAVNRQVRAIFGAQSCAAEDGLRVLNNLGERLGAAAGLPPGAVTLEVLRSPIANAVTLPGGRILIFSGLIARAGNGEEVVAVVAHEIGHVAHRDGLRRLLQSSGSSFLIGLLFGDVLGGGVIVTLAHTLIDSAHSREAESAADLFAADLLVRLGQSPAALGDFLTRLDKGDGPIPAILRSHPLSEARVAALANHPRRESRAALLGAADWQSLRAICGTGE